MKPSCLKLFLRGIGIAIATVLWISTLAIAQPYPSPTVWFAQTSVEQSAANSNPVVQTAAPSSDVPIPPDKTIRDRQPKRTPNNAQASVEPKQGQSGGPYDLKTIEESYRSLYGS